jgi:hypothetical protein
VPTSNIDEIAAYLRSLPLVLDLRRDGLAEEVFDLWGDRIHTRFEQEAGVEGKFEENRGDYGERKRERGVPIGIGLYGEEIGGEMSQRDNFVGRTSIHADEATMFFGATLKNRRKGMWFHSGSNGYDDQQDVEHSGAIGQPSRPFFLLLDEDMDAAVDLLEERLMARLGSTPVLVGA